jgi:hypothetical protein
MRFIKKLLGRIKGIFSRKKEKKKPDNAIYPLW